MTLGKKLALHRKAVGLSQEEVALKIRVSTKTLANWENNIGEPSIQNIKDFAKLFDVSIDELIDTNISNAESDLATCQMCGVTITNKNLGEESPEFLCRRCVEVKKARERRAEMERKALVERQEKMVRAKRIDEYNAFRLRQKTIKRRRTKSLIVAAIPTLLWAALLIYLLNKSYSDTLLIAGAVFAYALFSEIAILFYAGSVRNFLLRMFTASINMPGLMYTFDLDGFHWIIMMRGLFILIQLVIGFIFAVLGFIFGLFIAPFVFPYKMIKILVDIKHGDVTDYI